MSNDILIKTKGTLRKNNKITYILNIEFLTFFIELSRYKNPNLSNFDIDILKLLGIEKPINCLFNKNLQDGDPFIDDKVDVPNHHLDDGIDDSDDEN